MHTNIDRLNKELLHEKSSLWYVHDEEGYRILVKASGTAIRALSKGARIELSFGRDSHASLPIFHAGYRIHDDAVAHLSVTGLRRFYEEHYALEGIMRQDVVVIQFHDELCACIATAQLTIDEVDRANVLNLLDDIAQLYCGDFNKRAIKSLDAFDFSLGQRASGYLIETLAITCTLTDWKPISVSFYLKSLGRVVTIVGDNEGEVQEKQALVVLDGLFGNQLHPKPQIPYKKGRTRELTDVLAVYDYGIFLIESKALSILSADDDRTMDRKVAGLQKQIEKAIDQIIGGAKKVLENVPIYEINGKELFFDRGMYLYGIVLVSELLPFGN